MHRQLLSLGLLCLLPTCLGCAMCCGPDDYNYAAHGGRWQRHDMAYGRVASVFAEAGYDTLGDEVPIEPAEGADEPRPIPGDDEIMPTPMDEEVTGVDSSYNELATFLQ